MKKLLTLFVVVLLLSIPLAQSVSYTYDGRGNRISGDGYYREYDSFNHLVRIYSGDSPILTNLISNYSWALTEERTEIKYVYFNGTLNETVFYPREDWVRVVNSSGSFDFFYYILNGKIIGMKDFNGKQFVILNDHKGSAYAVIDENKNVLELTFYDPYGGIISGGQYTRFDYEGEEQDPTTGDSDFDARSVDTLLGAGMFIQPDQVIQNVYDPQTLNHYAFERANPYGNTDETGFIVESTADAFETSARYLAVADYVRSRREVARNQEYSEILLEYQRENPNSFNVPTFEELAKWKLDKDLGVTLKENGEIYGYTDQENGPYVIEYYLEQGYTRDVIDPIAEEKRVEAVASLSYSEWRKTEEGQKTYKQMKETIFKQVEEARERQNNANS